MQFADSRALFALVFVAACQTEGPPPRSAFETPATTAASAPAPTVAAPVAAPPTVACLETWPSDEQTTPDAGLRDAVAVCIDGKSFDGPPLRELLDALGHEIVKGQKPKCAMGYPGLTLVTKDGSHSELQFCGNVGAKAGYFYFDGLELRVKNPEAVDDWLRRNGLLRSAK